MAAGRRRRARGAARHADLIILRLDFDPDAKEMDAIAAEVERLCGTRGPRMLVLGASNDVTVVRGRRR